MPRLLITADIHGFYSVWQKLLSRLQPEDVLVIAGDFFGNRYPYPNNPDYQPESLRREYQDLPNPKYFVYGNCDRPEFFPAQKYALSFVYENKKVLLYHGDSAVSAGDHDIIITGHSHVAEIKEYQNKLYINPGSPSLPRKGRPSYAIYQRGRAEILEFGAAYFY
ncbi:metallophosphatase superfamily [Candidatus Termititenax aidoneus]|uniref:Phosphoesterase n=1 Tax=Termititenax aidoneus TaxID=2218524 RepID=A0A388TBR2_TERA1|nr:metallophosphatase superfamily [Candidatus Termititenax aidoneus]